MPALGSCNPMSPGERVPAQRLGTPRLPDNATRAMPSPIGGSLAAARATASESDERDDAIVASGGDHRHIVMALRWCSQHLRGHHYASSSLLHGTRG